MIRKALLERNSLHGICRIFSVSLTWLLAYMTTIFAELPEDLNFKPRKTHNNRILLYSLEVEMDEMWIFVQYKKNKQWIWIALDVQTHQIIAFVS